MKRFWTILCTVALLCGAIPYSCASVSAAVPTMALDRTVYEANDTVTVTYNGTDTNDWVGIYPAGLLPGSGQNSLMWEYTVGSGTKTFATSSLEAGEYVAFLCDNDGYTVLDREGFTVRSTDWTDYGVRSATVNAQVTQGKRTLSVTVEPSSAATLTYRLYWTKNGIRLKDYLPIKELTHSGAESFVMWCNDCVFMPDEADGIEVAVTQGHSTSFITAAPEKLKVPKSTYRYSFQVLTDLHASSSLPAHIPNLKAALRDVAALSPNSKGIFTAGDNTDRGTQDQYDLLLQTLAAMKQEVALPPIHFAIGNHDEVYGGTYQEEIERFISNFGVPGLYYSVEVEGTRFLILGSEEQTTAGTIGDAQLAWVEQQLASTDPTKPVFLLLHQPLKDTVSGTLSWKNSTIQRWYLGEAASLKLKAILAKYPNAVLFSGHTHSSFAQEQPFLYGEGTGASFVNAASTAYLWNDQNEDFAGSQGLYVDVYEDYILVKGRDFTHGKWCATAQFLIPIDGGGTYEGSLVSKEAADWSYDASAMTVESDGYATVLYNTDGLWPKAEYVYDEPITFDPDSTQLYVDMTLEEGAMGNLYLLTPNGAPLSLAPYIPKTETDASSGDLIGHGVRARGVIDLATAAKEAGIVGEDGMVTLAQTRLFVSGEAYAPIRIYDLSLVNRHSEKTVSLMNAQTLEIVDRRKAGGYRYQNGQLVVEATSAQGYQVQFALEETYNVEALKYWLLKATATTTFDVTLTATTANGIATFGLAADFWPELCQAKENGYLPSGTYENAVNLYSAYTYNQAAPADGRSTLCYVTVTLGGEGTLTLDGLQLSSETAVRQITDGVYKQEQTSSFAVGDVNGDGAVSTTDARIILMSTIGGELTDEQRALADINGDGIVSSADVRSLILAVLG